jgi:hypothetical protein
VTSSTRRARRALHASLVFVLAIHMPARAVQCPDYSPLKNVYFGDLHTHTAFSLDAYLFGTRTDPAQAYAFAQGAAVDIGTGYNPANEAPGPFGVTIDFSGHRLDFAAVTDHSEWLASDYGCSADASSPFYASSYCVALRAHTGSLAGQPCNGVSDGTGTGCLAVQTDAWAAERQATEDAYDACTFTTFHAYEWTLFAGVFVPKVLHKNVFFKDASVPSVPLDAVNYPTGPALWAGLAAECNPSTHCEALTIPHNMNQSNGLAFDVASYSPIDLNRMTKFQRLVEVHQHKGNSECVTDTADTGAVATCDFEVDPALSTASDAAGYARPGLEQGLTRFSTGGLDPLKFGFVGGTDNHDATPGNVAESTFPGFLGSRDNTPERRLYYTPKYNPGGITGVWAEENTREAIWSALKRRETFATSGPRLTVRFYAYTAVADPCADPDFPRHITDAGGIPMGGTIPHADGPPSFVAYALQDQVPLASIDIVKASVVGGASIEKVYALPLGSAPYCLTWTDPDFDPAAPAFWYARVKEQPTWRWSHYDCAAIRQRDPSNWQTIAPGCASSDPAAGGLDYMLQERAWTSSIWYLPGGPVTVRAASLELRDPPDPAHRSFLFRVATKGDPIGQRVASPIPGSAADPTVNGASGGGAMLTVYNPETGETAALALPAAGWRLESTGTRYTFADPGGPVRKVTVRPDHLYVRGGGSAFAFTLDEPRQGTMAVRLQLGTAAPWCAEVPAKSSDDTVGRFVGEPKTAPPEQCPLPGSPG